MASVWQRYPRLKLWLLFGAIAGIGLFAIGQHYFYWFWYAAMVMANVLFFSGVIWLFWRLFNEQLAVSREVKAAMMEFQLKSDATVEAGNGGYPCTELLQRYRGLIDGQEVCLLKVMLGSGRRMGFGWFAATKIFPPFQQKFRLTAQRYPAPPPTRLHPRLTKFAVAFCDRPGWVESWIDSLPEPALAALNAQLEHEPATTVTDHEVYRRVDELTDGGRAAPMGVAFRELIALARSLATSAEAANDFSIHTSFHYVRYQEGAESFELTIDPGTTGAWVYVPTAENWPKQMPAWAAGRREEIVARLREHLDKSFEFVDG